MPHPRYLSELLSSYETAEWIAYMNIEPFGQPHQDIVMGTISATVANANRDAKRRPRPYTALDFLPTRVRPPKQDELEAKLHAVMSVLGGE